MEIRDERPQPWAWFEHEIIDHYARDMGPIGISVYMALLRFCGATQTCYPSYEAIESRLGLSHQSVWRGIQKLVELKLISVEQRRSGPKGRASNVYTIQRPSRCAISSDKQLVPNRNKPKPPKDNNKSEVSSPQELTEAEVSSLRELTKQVSSPQELTIPNVTESLTNHVTIEHEIAEVSSLREQTVSSLRELEVDTTKTKDKDKETPPENANAFSSPSSADSDEGTESPPVKKGRARKVQSLCPEDYQPSAQVVQRLLEDYPGVDIPRLVRNMKNWSASKGEMRRDWDATLRTFADHHWEPRGVSDHPARRPPYKFN
jgi:hypothetical protein